MSSMVPRIEFLNYANGLVIFFCSGDIEIVHYFSPHPVWGGTACQITARSSCARRNCSVK